MKNNISEEGFRPIRKRLIEISENQLLELRGTVTDFNSKTLYIMHVLTV